MSHTVELPRVREPGGGLGGHWRVIVLNDDFNTFDHVAETLASVIPEVSLADGYRIADQIHNRGMAMVYGGPREEAEYYWQKLDAAGLSLGPLESG
jgi:ATP-dependent Clp protease adaptor protein ClpS